MRFVVDRLEADVVVVTDGRRSFDLPGELFATRPLEGDVVDLVATTDGDAAARTRSATVARREALSRDDDGGDFGL
jgi:hypothetical protein